MADRERSRRQQASRPLVPAALLTLQQEMNMELTASGVRATSTKELITATARRIIVALETYLAPLLDLAVRFWLARVFFMSGLTKIQSWDSTLSLFENEYAV